MKWGSKVTTSIQPRARERVPLPKLRAAPLALSSKTTTWQKQLGIKSEILFKKFQKNFQLSFQALIRHEDLGGHRAGQKGRKC